MMRSVHSKRQLFSGFVFLFLAAFCLQPGSVFAKKVSEKGIFSPVSAISITFAVTNPNCAGQTNGAITASATGGTAPYTYTWSNGASGATITGLGDGAYTVNVVDATGAQASASANVTAPAALNSSAWSTAHICGNNPDGTASVTAWGGTPPYSFAWSGGKTGATITGLSFGIYSVTTTDSKGCTSIASAEVFDATYEGIWVVVDNSTPCFGNGGFLHAGAMSGTPPYSYLWSNGATTQDISGLANGSYTVTVSDASGCQGVVTATVTSLPQINLNINATNAACGTANGTASVTITGGQAPYTVTWSNGASGTTITGLSAGTYTANVTDAKGCTASKSVTVQGGSGSAIVINFTGVSMAGCTTQGSATASPSGGTAPYIFLWSNGSTSATANLAAGNATVTVTDASGCSNTNTVNIPGAPSISVAASTTQQAGCAGAGGTATATVTGGTGTITYKWSNNATTQSISGLAVGTYTVTATDGMGCTASASTSVTQVSSPSASAGQTSAATCTTGGSASVNVTGGTAPFSYVWSNMATTQSISGLSAGAYGVTVTDANGCTAASSATIQGANLPSASATATGSAACTGNGGGTAAASASGGTAPYSFKWSNGQTTQNATNLSGGPATVTVTDANGCTASATVNISQAAGPSGSTIVGSNAICNLGGTATVTPTGGTAPYSYKWDNNQTTQTATNLSAGPHTVTITDASGCTGTATVSIQQAGGSVGVTVGGVTNSICGAGGTASATATGGTGNVTFAWSNGATTAAVTGLTPGAYTVTATDANGCSGTQSITIQNIPGTKIGDYVWFDNSQDGFQQAAETGVNNIKVKLMTAGPDGAFGTADDFMVTMVSTNAQGKYLFDCVAPGQYILKFEGLPAGHQWTKKDAANDCGDSDVDASGRTSPFTVTAGMPDNLCFDAGIHVICDQVMSAGSICCDQTICEGTAPAQIYGVLPPLMGSGALEWLWLELVTIPPGNVPTWVEIPGSNSSSYQPPVLFSTKHYMRCVRRAGCLSFLESNVVTITVKPLGSPGCISPFVSFNGSMNGTSVDLDWTVAPEHSKMTYLVEHSTNGQNWQSIAQVAGQNNPTANNRYDFMHDAPIVGKNFYRIQRLNQLGEGGMSEEIEISMAMDKTETVKITPNPVTDLLLIQNLMEYDEAVSIDLLDAAGRTIRSTTLPKNAITKKQLDFGGYPAGMYFVRINFGKGESKTVKLTKIQ